MRKPYTPNELRTLSKQTGPQWSGEARAALSFAADVIDAANTALAEKALRQIAEFGEAQNAQVQAPIIGCVQHDCAECRALLAAPKARELSDAEIEPFVRTAIRTHMQNYRSAAQNACVEVAYEVARAVLAARIAS